ncbi:MAG: MarC family protein [bacterium]|nr:MarC family protein [bacterium]
MTLARAIILLLLVTDPIGNAVVCASFFKSIEPRRQAWVAMRESAIAFAILLAFLLGGGKLLDLLQIREPSLTFAGAVVLLLIAIRLIFPPREGLFGEMAEGEPFIVPIATPLLAGPSAIAIVMLLASKDPSRYLEWIVALLVVCAICGVCMLISLPLARFLGSRGVTAVEKLLGLLLTAMAIQMFINGLQIYRRLAI